MLHAAVLPTYIAALPNHDKMAAKLKDCFQKNGLSIDSVQKYLVHHRFTIFASIIQKNEEFHYRGKKGLGDFPVDPHS
jgi:hypothetical protein